MNHEPIIAPKVTIIPATQIVEDERTGDGGEPKKLRVAAYARVSTEQDEQQNSYAAQLDYYTRFIQNNPDWEFVDVFADEGISGTNTKKRDGFNLMISKAIHGEIDLILTKSISRFARNTVDTLQIVRKLKEKGVEVIFEKENLHSLDPKCEVMLTIMSSLAQEESRSISENVRWGQRKRMEEGKVSLAYSCFLGYRKGEDGRPEIVEEEAVIIRRIYDEYLAGKSHQQIADGLTNDGIPTPKGKQVWSSSTVRGILRNEKYKGDALLQKTYTVDFLTKKVKKNNGEVPSVLVHNSHEPIIEPAVFDEVQKLLDKNVKRKAKVRSHYPYSGRIVCGDCGEFYGHKTWQVRSTKEKYDVWYCNHKYEGVPCSTPPLRIKDIAALFERMLTHRGEANTTFSEKRWTELVETMTVYSDRKVSFLLKDGSHIDLK